MKRVVDLRPPVLKSKPFDLTSGWARCPVRDCVVAAALGCSAVSGFDGLRLEFGLANFEALSDAQIAVMGRDPLLEATLEVVSGSAFGVRS